MNLPHIENLTQAIAMGQSVGDVLGWDRGWVERVFQGDPTKHPGGNTGPRIINRALSELWTNDMTDTQRELLIIKYTEYLLSR